VSRSGRISDCSAPASCIEETPQKEAENASKKVRVSILLLLEAIVGKRDFAELAWELGTSPDKLEEALWEGRWRIVASDQ
jgi:hypothetical protein